ncbi:MAG: efflux RND transporter permease subunit [Mariprofundus sp.]|nr:efflux RND transporter permease subunit [Mariprofundus sp.]
MHRNTSPFPSASRLLNRWVSHACSKTHWVLILAVLLTGAAFHYTTNHLGFNTNTNDMLSAELPFRQIYHRFEQGFPQYTHTILLVIDADTPEQARAAAKQMAAVLEQQPTLFLSVYLPRANTFMESHALLYQSMDDLEQTADDLAGMQAFLGRLTDDPGLSSLFLLLKDALEHETGADTVDITPILNPISVAIEAAMNNGHAPLSWQELMHGSDATEATKQRQQFILLQPRMDFSNLLAAGPAMAAVRNAAAGLHLDAQHGVRVRMTGSAALSHDELISVSTGAGAAALIALLLVGALLTLGFGSFRFVVATLLCLLVGLLLTAAFAALVIGHLNLISVAFAVLYIGLGVDYAIHLCLRCREIEQTGQATTEALWQAARDVGVSLLLCAITTAVGFYCFVPTDYTGVSELGIISGSGMFISLVVTLTLLPAILCAWDRISPTAHAPAIRRKEAIRWRLPAMFTLHARMVRMIAVAIALVAALWLPQARFDYNPMHLRDQTSESITTYNDLVAGHAISPSSIMVLTPDAEKVHLLQQRLSALESVDKTISLFNFIPSNQGDKLDLIDEMALLLGVATHPVSTNPAPLAQQLDAIEQLKDALNRSGAGRSGAGEAASNSPDRQLHQHLQAFSRLLADQPKQKQQQMITALEQDLLATLPATLDLLQTALAATPISRQSIPDDLSRRWFSESGLYRIEVTPKDDIGDIDHLRRFVAQVRSVAPDATGAPVFTLEAGDAVIGAFMQAFAIALALIFLLLLLLLRSLVDTVLILLPLLLAALLIVAGTVLLDIPFNFANVIALPLLLGIGVDNGIHMVQRFRDMQYDSPSSIPPAQHDLLASSTSKAVVLSALTTICSFGALSFSPHQGTADMGQLLMLGIVMILICTLIVLPAFLQLTFLKLQPGEATRLTER